MSKPVRLKDYLHAELEKIAARENRSLTNLVNHLLEQAIAMDHKPITKKEIVRIGKEGFVSAESITTPAAERNRTDADSQPRDVPSRTIKPSGATQPTGPTSRSEAAVPEDHFRPDPKPQGKKK